MKSFAVAAVAALGAAVSGCATVFEGTSQEISVVTNPPGASCSFERQGMQVGAIANTPGTANIRKSKYDIIIKCDKPGYQQAQFLDHSGVSAAIAGNVAADLLLTWGLSSVVDSADGADNKYDSAVTMTLLPISGQAALSQLPAPSPFPLQMHCKNPDVDGTFAQDGPFGYVTARIRFQVNSSSDSGSVNVSPAAAAVCTVSAKKGTILASASFAFEPTLSWTAGGNSPREIEQHVDIAESRPDGSHATFTIKAKDETQGTVTLAFPITYR
ncbi:MAG: hypothetical protein JOY77_13045 [Alphaproteobacteria bacterium]|nr:hypothetical protein [Alphaproteobacteria bacterium]MBV9063835.1 hypothetical protein [Alphaproteobacteria bacterium]